MSTDYGVGVYMSWIGFPAETIYLNFYSTFADFLFGWELL